MEHSRLIEKIQSTAGYRTITISNKGSNKSTTNNNTATQSTTKSPPLVVADMMAGVGPFAVPLAMPLYSNNITRTMRERDIIVHANGKNMGLYWFSHYLCWFYRVFLFIREIFICIRYVYTLYNVVIHLLQLLFTALYLKCAHTIYTILYTILFTSVWYILYTAIYSLYLYYIIHYTIY